MVGAIVLVLTYNKDTKVETHKYFSGKHCRISENLKPTRPSSPCFLFACVVNRELKQLLKYFVTFLDSRQQVPLLILQAAVSLFKSSDWRQVVSCSGTCTESEQNKHHVTALHSQKICQPSAWPFLVQFRQINPRSQA